MAARRLRLSPHSHYGTRRALQREFVALREEYARIAGYKISLTEPAAQRRYGLASPAIGVLFDDMLLSDGAVVNARAGRQLGYEADLLVRVGDEAINAATALWELLPHLNSVIAFLELPDLLVRQRVASSGRFLATNAGARLGVLGSEIEVPKTT